ncbi:MAG: hypothetical protein GWO24_35720, partial [Akkermansiaceae bacterium]|nr:hypothetical protein [Akkermansiaceae bacterium]
MNMKSIFSLMPLWFALPASAAVIHSAESGNWSEARTWEEEIAPEAGDEVVIGAGHKVIYDVRSEEVIRSIRVAGRLEFATVRSTELNVGNIRIQPGSGPAGSGVEDVPHDHEARPAGAEAALVVGSPDQPVRRGISARIRLHFQEGMAPEESPAIVARPGGRMEFHGTPMSRTWVKLGADVKPGARDV